MGKISVPCYLCRTVVECNTVITGSVEVVCLSLRDVSDFARFSACNILSECQWVLETRRRARRSEDTALRTPPESPRASDNTPPAQLTRDQPNTCHHRLHELQTLAPRRTPPEPGGARSRGAERSWRRGRPHRSSQRSACRRRRSRTGLAAAPAGAAPRARVPAAAASCRLLGVAPPWRGRSEAAQPRAP